jgi:hypothetical protein
MISCRKDQSCGTQTTDVFITDTIFPSPYLSAYPGSWWQYSNGTIDSCTIWESVPQYITEQDDNGCTNITRKWSIVPKFNVNHIHNRSVLSSNADLNKSSLTQKVGDVGEQWQIDKSTNEAILIDYYSCDSFFDYKTVNGTSYSDVIMVTFHDYKYFHHTASGPPSEYYYKYYAKDVGLIMTKYHDPVSGEIVFGRQLEEYFIAPY